MAIDKITTASITDANITTAKLAYQAIPFRNIIINGSMDLAQRGTSATGLTNGSGGYHTCDRWRFTENGSPSFQFTQSQSTDVPTGQGFATSLKMDVTTADTSLAAADGLKIEQRIEGQMLQYLKKGTSSAESTTLSFWVKSNKTGTYICQLRDVDNSRSISKSYTISSANTWEKKTITYPGDTSGAFGNDNASSLQFALWLGAGSNYSSGTLGTTWSAEVNANRAVGQVNLADNTSNEWYVTGVQLEAGTTASDFEFLPVDVNLQRCQRYFYKLIDVPIGDSGGYFTSGFLYSSSTLYSWNEFPTMMRAAPTLSSSNGTDYFIFYRDGAGDNFNYLDLTLGRTNGAMIRNNANISGTAGQTGGLHTTSNSKVTFSAEL